MLFSSAFRKMAFTMEDKIIMKIGWVDFSNEDREKVLDVMSLLQEQGAVDELGFGQVRDGFANYFFPGTSTVQTRAKYFLIVPYILQEAVSGKYGDSFPVIMRRIDENEKDCGIRLYKRYENNPIGVGIIGARILPKRWVARKPSNIYWSGIRTFGISLQYAGSISDIVKLSVMDRMQKKKNKVLGNREISADEEERDDSDAGRTEDIKFFDLPEDVPKDWRETLDIELTPEEAVFLKEKIINSVPDSLLAWLMKNGVDVAQYTTFEMMSADLQDMIPESMMHMMKLACQFNRLVYAARVRYNVILSGGRNELANQEWAVMMQDIGRITEVDLEDLFLSLKLIDFKFKRFVSEFKAALTERNETRIDELILKREIDLKTKSRAKLCHSEDYDPNGWVGGGFLDYRFSDAQQLILDIYKGEEGICVSN